jgi:L-alanine-DL-glutamate epimerase-like enolase superfamily enzyme
VSGDPIAAVEAVSVTLPLPTPVRLGASDLKEREYALVRVTTGAGLVGSAYCLTRGAPIVEAVDRLITPVLLGEDSDAIEARFAQGSRATIMSGRSGVVMRALGLVDIALWDIKGRRASTPLWRLLGGFQPSVAALLVAGYRLRGGSLPALADELVAYALRGHRLIKVARIDDRESMTWLLREVVSRLPAASGLVVDAGYGWSTVAEALDEIGAWDIPLTWLEDPFPPERAAAIARLRERCPHPLAVGDEASAAATRALLETRLIDYLRLDIPAVGGITPALALMTLAAAAEIPVSFHVYPEISIHLAAARAQASIVESFDTTLPGGNPFDPAHLLTGIALPMDDGRITASEEPGLGFTLAWPGEG